MEIPASELSLARTPFASGCNGDIYDGTFKSEPCAVKKATARGASPGAPQAALLREIRLLSTALHGHAHIVKLFGHSSCSSSSSVMLVMERCSTSLLHKINQLRDDDYASSSSLPQRSRYAWELAKALRFVHEQGIIHRDVKPANLLLSFDDRVRLADFGSACGVPEGIMGRTMTGQVGTFRYMAPEVFAHHRVYRESADVYSYGMVAYFIFTGRAPFCGGEDGEDLCTSSSMEAAERALQGERPSFTSGGGGGWRVDAKIQRAIQRAWSAKASDRPTMQELVHELAPTTTAASRPCSGLVASWLHKLRRRSSTLQSFSSSSSSSSSQQQQQQQLSNVLY